MSRLHFVDGLYLTDSNEIQDRMIELGKYIEKCGAVVNGSVVTTTHRVFDDCRIDMEIILPINKKVLSCNKMIFKNKIKIYDALYAAVGSQSALVIGAVGGALGGLGADIVWNKTFDN
ncbi:MULTISPECIES: hypothetical protein [unclassified Fusibacter]|uniref:hypothetical protein n=1 Tax=unclassified Fusibacter TaxID=2624464 RepID=UPI001013611F|nr:MULTISPECIES: hypothetical protein [unclassified Fusibacter]MCK8058142.1 hypothetical protein [Fusibacter sp. A2]NPE20724.1 hypothetical protein [Fusibacter sp. A1]RXV62928.1 hypothetical protein DWB64_02740 [Fusibacter sp. A1]